MFRTNTGWCFGCIRGANNCTNSQHRLPVPCHRTSRRRVGWRVTAHPVQRHRRSGVSNGRAAIVAAARQQRQHNERRGTPRHLVASSQTGRSIWSRSGSSGPLRSSGDNDFAALSRSAILRSIH